MLDYQFLGLVAVVLAVVSRGSLLPVVTVTGVIGLLTLAGEVATRWYRRRHPQPRPGREERSAHKAGVAAPTPSDGNFQRWMAAAERVIRSAE
jgi:hypothetical protein